MRRERRQSRRKAQVLDLMTMARVSRGDEMAEVYVAGTIGYVIRIELSKPSGRPPVHPNVQCIRSAQFSLMHPSLQPPTDLSIYPV